MAMRAVSFAIDEWFHCFNRGIEKRTIYESEADSERFLQLLYLCNSTTPVHRSNLSLSSTEEILLLPRASFLVSIGAYCLMPNHYHLLLKEITDGGITRFMQKLGTAYTMYFNKKYERTGNLLAKPFRAKHVGEDRYFQRVVDYIHCNPAEHFEPQWQKGIVSDMHKFEQKLLDYRYSSFADYGSSKRDLAAILSNDGFKVYRETTPRQMLEDTRMYYADLTVQ